MARLYVFAEGKTEMTFAKTLLGPHLAPLNVYLQGVVEVAHARKKGRVHRGGGRRYEPIKNDIQRFSRQESSPDTFFTTMIDLYALAADFPGREQAEKLSHLPFERVKVLEAAFAEDIADSRFIPFLQLHEIEAYLFVDPDSFVLLYENRSKGIAELKRVAAGYSSPEQINEGQHISPSKRIRLQIPEYDKVSDCSLVAQQIGLDRIRACCPHFRGWLERLEGLGAQASGRRATPD